MGAGTPTREAASVPVMADHRPPHTLVYVDSDIPEGMTLAEWRRSRRAGQARRTPLRSTLGRVVRRPYLREIALAVVAYLIYEGARLLTAGSYPPPSPTPSRSSASSATSASTSRAPSSARS